MREMDARTKREARVAKGKARSPENGSNKRQDLERLFHPDAVAIVGSVNRKADPGKLRAFYDERWGAGKWYLVNAKGGSVGDVRIYERVTDVPVALTLAVVNVGTKLVAGVMEECGKHGVPYVLVFTAGFSEVGPKGAALEREVGEMAGRYGIRVFGPNTNTNAFEALPEPPRVRGGRIGLVTQSGHQGRPIVQGTEFGVAFSRWVPTGNELDLDAADFIEYFAYDDRTAVIAGYFEGFRDPSKLRRALEAANDQRKPVVALKVGSTSAGTRMAASHTGHLAGSDAVVSGLFAQHGVVRVRDLDELLETAALFAKLPAGTGPNCCLYSISGGSGALMAEVAESHGVPVPLLSPRTQAALHEVLPDYLTVGNPVDNGAQFLVSAPEADRRRVLELVASDPAIDVIVVGITGALGRLTDRFAEDLAAFADELPKPVVVTWNSFKTDDKGFSLLVETGLPMFRSFRGCFAALDAFAGYQRAAERFRHRRSLPARLPAAAREVMESLPPGPPRSSRRVLDAVSSTALLASFGVPMPAEGLAGTAADAARLATEIGPPVVMKIASADFPHKSDAGLVVVGVPSPAEARRTFSRLVERAREVKPGAHLDGVTVHQQVEGGIEMIVGVTRDPVLGPAIMVGTGGVFAEVLADVAVRPLPVDRRDAEEMVRSLKGAALLAGARGRARGDLKALVDVIMSVARLASACGEELLELDLNPVTVLPTGALALDSLVVLASKPAEARPPAAKKSSR
jgi:acyl-CoA synthetase (NDP forming)